MSLSYTVLPLINTVYYSWKNPHNYKHQFAIEQAQVCPQAGKKYICLSSGMGHSGDSAWSCSPLDRDAIAALLVQRPHTANLGHTWTEVSLDIPARPSTALGNGGTVSRSLRTGLRKAASTSSLLDLCLLPPRRSSVTEWYAQKGGIAWDLQSPGPFTTSLVLESPRALTFSSVGSPPILPGRVARRRSTYAAAVRPLDRTIDLRIGKGSEMKKGSLFYYTAFLHYNTFFLSSVQWSDPVGARQPKGRRASRVQPLSVQKRRPLNCALVTSGGAATFP